RRLKILDQIPGPAAPTLEIFDDTPLLNNRNHVAPSDGRPIVSSNIAETHKTKLRKDAHTSVAAKRHWHTAPRQYIEPANHQCTYRTTTSARYVRAHYISTFVLPVRLAH